MTQFKGIHKLGLGTLSVFLSILMVLYLIPLSVYAELAPTIEGNEDTTAQTEQTEQITEEPQAPDAMFELTDRREQNVKHFRLSDGSIVAAQYAAPIHEQDENGEWQDIDNTLGESGNEYATPGAKIKFAKKITGDQNLFTLHDGKYKITMSLDGAIKKTTGSVTNTQTEFGEDTTQLQKMMTLDKLSAKIMYADILDGVDLEYVLESVNIKENIIVKEKKNSYTYTFTLDLGNLTAALQEDGSIHITDPDSGEVKYRMPAPIVYDAAGITASASLSAYTLTKTGNHTYALSVTVNADWMNDEERAFPVTVDPTIEHKESTGATVQSAYVSSEEIVDHTKTNTRYVAKYTRGAECLTYVLIENLPTIPQNAVIINAELVTDVSLIVNGPICIGVKKVSSTWSKDNITFESKPNCYSTLLDYKIITAQGRQTFNITPAVCDWIEGSPNYGLQLELLIAPGALTSDKCVLFRSEGNTSKYPSFSITYRDTKGIESYYSYYTASAGLPGTGYINSFTGNLAFVHSSLGTTDEIMPYTLALTYNSCLSNLSYINDNAITPFTTSVTGAGFKLSTDETIMPITVSGATFYIWADADGTEHYFYQHDYYVNGTLHTEWLDEDGLGLQLLFQKNSDNQIVGYILQDDLGNKKCFNAAGYMTSIEDANGNSRIFSRTGTNQVAYISFKPNGGSQFTQLYFSYTNDGKLSSVRNLQTNMYAMFSYSENTAGIVYLSQIMYLYGSNSTHTVTFEYDTNGKLILVRDLSSGQALGFSYRAATGKVTGIQQYAGATSTNTTADMTPGQKAAINTTSEFATYHTAGNDGIMNFSTLPSDDVYTYYRFDNTGKVTSAYTTSGDLIYSATNYLHEPEDSVKTKNALTSVTVMDGSAVNLLANPGLDEIDDSNDAPSGWSMHQDSLVESTGNDPYINSNVSLMINSTVSRATLSRKFFAEAGTYTASVNFAWDMVEHGRARIVIYDEYYRLYAASDYFTALNTNQNYSNMAERKSITFTTNSACATSGWTLSIEFESPAGVLEDEYLGVDSIMLEKGTAPSNFSEIGNGGFEYGSTDWTLIGASVQASSAAAFDGQKGVCITGTPHAQAYAMTTLPQVTTPSLDYTTNAPTSFVLSGWAKATSIASVVNEENAAAFALKAVFHYANGQSTEVYVPFDSTQHGWQYVSGVVSSEPINGQYYQVSSVDVYCCYDYNANTAYFDNISLVRDSAQVTNYTYNERGRLVGTTSSNGQGTTLDYDSTQVDITGVTTSSGLTSSMEYDTKHRVTKAIDHNGTNCYSVTYDYDDYGNVIQTVTSSDVGTTTSLITSSTYASSTHASAAAYFGAVTEHTDETGTVTKYFYLDNGLLESVIGPDGNGLIYSYDVYGQLIGAKPAILQDGEPVENDDLLHQVQYTYDRDVALDKITTPTAQYQFLYDDFGNTTQIKVNNTPLATYTYQEGNGKLLSLVYGNHTDEKPMSVQYHYDAIDRISGICYNGVEEKAFTYVYNTNGALAEHRDNTNGRTYVYTYDASGRVTQITQKSNDDSHVTFMQEITYDAQGRTSGVYYHYPDLDTHTLMYTEYTYNEMGGIDSVTSTTSKNGSTATSYTYDDFGRISTESNTFALSSDEWLFDKYYYFESDSVNNSGVYENSARVEQLLITENTNNYWYYYTYDARGNITEIRVEKNGTEVENYQYEYDTLGQLTRENIWRLNNSNASKTIAYDYDTGGNRISKKTYTYTEDSLEGKTCSQTTWGYAQDTDGNVWNDVMVSFSGNAVETDAIGNTLSDGRYTYEWQNGRQLRKITLDADSVITFTYNADGIRTGKYYGESSASDGWEYTVDGSKIIRQVLRQADGSITMEYRFFYDANGMPKSFRIRNFNTDGSVNKDITCHYATNLQGDIVALYNDAGERIAEYTYDAWGNLLRRSAYNTTATTAVENNWVAQMNPFRYRGYYWDSETGFYYLQSRYYDPEMGRFLNADGYINANGDLIGFNMYAYCSNNPVMYTDPTGENGISIGLELLILTVSYTNVFIASFFDKQIREDMKKIKWNPLNADVKAVGECDKVSFYKGQFVVYQNITARSGSFMIMFLNPTDKDETTIRHEWGHFSQLSLMDPGLFLLSVGLPSWRSGGQSELDYYSHPWDRLPDALGGVDRSKTTGYKKGSLVWGIAQIIDPITVPILYAIFGQ